MYLSLASPFLLHGCLFVEKFVRKDDSSIQLILHHESACASKHRLVQMPVSRCNRYRKDRIGVAITKRGGDVIADLIAAQREPGDIHGSGQSEFLRPVSTSITRRDKADIEL